MKSPFDQNPEQETEQQYERNLARNYPADERAKIRASDQRESYQAATLKLNAEKEAQNARDSSIKLRIAQAAEARAVTADTLAAAKNSAQNAFDERDREIEQKAAGQAVLMLEEIKKRRNPNGYVSFEDLNEIDIMYPLASLSKNQRIAKMKDQERELTTSVMEKQAVSRENIAKEERAKKEKIDAENRAKETADKLGFKPTAVIDGKVVFGYEKPPDTGTRTVSISPGGLKTVTEKRPIAPDTTPAAATPAAAAPAAATAPTANPLTSIVSSGGKIKKIGDTYNAFDKDGKFIGSYSVGK